MFLIKTPPKGHNFPARINIANALSQFSDKCAWTSGEWEELNLEWNEIQNLPKHIRLLADHLIQLDHASLRDN